MNFTDIALEVVMIITLLSTGQQVGDPIPVSSFAECVSRAEVLNRTNTTYHGECTFKVTDLDASE